MLRHQGPVVLLEFNSNLRYIRMAQQSLSQRLFYLDVSNGYCNKWICSHGHLHPQFVLRHRPQCCGQTLMLLLMHRVNKPLGCY